MNKVLVVDDHSFVRCGIIRILEETSELEVSCEEASTSEEAVKKLLACQYKVVLLDISLNGENGLDLLCQLHQTRPSLPILIVSMHPEEQYAVHSLSLGAAGYLSKHSAPATLVDAVSTILSGGRYISAALAGHLADKLNVKETLLPHEKLSPRELQVLRMIGNGKTPTEIADLLFLSVKTISTYRVSTLKKMEMRTSAELMKYAISNMLV